MNLLVDVGNTRLKWATHRDGRIGEIQSIPHSGSGLAQILQSAWLLMHPPTRVTMSSVVPGTTGTLRTWIRRHWGVPVDEVLVTAEAFGIRCGYSQPAQLGVDRWMAVIGARTLSEGDLCIVDCGTAITVDGLTRDNHHAGGFIMPGLTLMRSTLAMGTGNLPDVSGVSCMGPAVNTRDAILGGTLHATVGGVQNAFCAMRQTLACEHAPKLFLTGGESSQIQPHLEIESIVVPELVFLGLARFAATN
jgi:type III pantothenate kinase